MPKSRWLLGWMVPIVLAAAHVAACRQSAVPTGRRGCCRDPSSPSRPTLARASFRSEPENTRFQNTVSASFDLRVVERVHLARRAVERVAALRHAEHAERDQVLRRGVEVDAHVVLLGLALLSDCRSTSHCRSGTPSRLAGLLVPSPPRPGVNRSTKRRIACAERNDVSGRPTSRPWPAMKLAVHALRRARCPRTRARRPRP